MKQLVTISFLVLTLTVWAASASASALDLGTAGDYNAFIFGNFTSQNSDTEGRLAAGGNVSLAN